MAQLNVGNRCQSTVSKRVLSCYDDVRRDVVRRSNRVIAGRRSSTIFGFSERHVEINFGNRVQSQ